MVSMLISKQLKVTSLKGDPSRLFKMLLTQQNTAAILHLREQTALLVEEHILTFLTSGQDVVLEGITSTLSQPPATPLIRKTIKECQLVAPKDDNNATTAPLDDSRPASHTVNPSSKPPTAYKLAKVKGVVVQTALLENGPHVEGMSLGDNTEAAQISSSDCPDEAIAQDTGYAVRSGSTPALAMAVNVSPVADNPVSAERFLFSQIDPRWPLTEVLLYLSRNSSTPCTDTLDPEPDQSCTTSIVNPETTNSCQHVAFTKDEAAVEHPTFPAPPVNQMHVEIIGIFSKCSAESESYRRVAEGACTTKFPAGTLFDDLVTHCEQAHSEFLNDLLGLDPGQLALIKSQMDESML
ncbi:unnamed protein product [Cyclocybe aegerita]|uniref:Uncharacterized protein n=1 Tax=Cyclocybe aegerita TaxID=1973307 RepID=A0A8S0VTV9_CYCAE|nr:unnamed protein product [Cyclocybe aegerita]